MGRIAVIMLGKISQGSMEGRESTCCHRMKIGVIHGAMLESFLRQIVNVLGWAAAILSDFVVQLAFFRAG